MTYNNFKKQFSYFSQLPSKLPENYTPMTGNFNVHVFQKDGSDEVVYSIIELTHLEDWRILVDFIYNTDTLGIAGFLSADNYFHNEWMNTSICIASDDGGFHLIDTHSRIESNQRIEEFLNHPMFHNPEKLLSMRIMDNSVDSPSYNSAELVEEYTVFLNFFGASEETKQAELAMTQRTKLRLYETHTKMQNAPTNYCLVTLDNQLKTGTQRFKEFLNLKGFTYIESYKLEQEEDQFGHQYNRYNILAHNLRHEVYEESFLNSKEHLSKEEFEVYLALDRFSRGQ